MKPRTLLVALASLGCATALAAPQGATGTSPNPPATNTQAPAAQPSAPATGGLGMTGTRPRHMANCPSALPGTTTSVTNTSDGVELQITTKDPAVEARLVQLARFHAMLVFPNWFVKPHSGLGGGPGTIGYCPIVHQDTLLTYAPIANGVRIHVATVPSKVATLQRETASRLAALKPRAAS